LSLLKPQGKFICDEFARENFTAESGRWLYERTELLITAGYFIWPKKLPQDPIVDPVGYWNGYHQHTPPLATGQEMIEATKKIFGNIHLVEPSFPFLFGYSLHGMITALKRPPESLAPLDRFEQVMRTLFEQEKRRLVGRIDPQCGLRFSATKG